MYLVKDLAFTGLELIGSDRKYLEGMVDEMVDVYEISMLLDFYGQLLTESQMQCLDLYYNRDLSLAEIAEELEISRQGVHDFIKRGRQSLTELEAKLGMLARFREIKSQLETIQEDLQYLEDQKLTGESKRIVSQVEEKLVRIITKL